MKHLFFVVALLACVLSGASASGKREKSVTLTGRVELFGSAPVDVVAGFVSDDGKIYALDAGETGLTFSELSALQGRRLSCTGIVKSRRRGHIAWRELKDGVFVLESLREVGAGN